MRRRAVLAAAVVAGGALAVTAAVVSTGGPASPAHASRAAPTSTTVSPRTLGEHGTVQVLHVDVPGDPNRKNDVYVYRPPVPDSPLLPVLYFLHGVPGRAKDVFDAGLPELMDSFFAQGNAPFVLVAPDGNGARHDDTEWANALDGSDQMETFVTKSVVQAVEGPNRRDRTRRAIAGFSMGGYGAANLGLRHPDLYDAVVPMAGYFHVDDPAGVFGNSLLDVVANTPELNLGASRRRRVFIVDGDEDNQRVVEGESEAAAATLMADGVPVWFQSSPGTHSWQFVAAAFPDVERFLDGGWIRLRPPPPEIPASLLPPSTQGHWVGIVDGALVDLSLPAPATDPTVVKLERMRKRLHRPPVSYVRVVITNPSLARRTYSLAKVSFVDVEGLTIDANAPAFALLGWTRDTKQSHLMPDVQRLIPSLIGSTIVAPGAKSTAIMVSTGPIPNVDSVFVGDSFGHGVLTAVGGGAAHP